MTSDLAVEPRASQSFPNDCALPTTKNDRVGVNQQQLEEFHMKTRDGQLFMAFSDPRMPTRREGRIC
jgi:hypothetical protein